MPKKVKEPKKPRIKKETTNNKPVKLKKKLKSPEGNKKEKVIKTQKILPAYDANGAYLDDYELCVDYKDNNFIRKIESTCDPEKDSKLEAALIEEEKQLRDFLENVARADALALYAKKPWYEKFWDFLKAMFS